MRQTVIVTDGMWRKSMSAVRSLGKAGYRVVVTGDSIFTSAFWSKYTAARIMCPSAKDDPVGFGETLTQYLKSCGATRRPVLLPMEDATLEWVSSERNELRDYCDFVIPDADALAVAQSKTATLALAEKLGLPVPETIVVADVGELLSRLEAFQAANEMPNYIVKPVTGSGSSGIVYLDGDRHIDWLQHWKNYGPLAFQKRLSSKGAGLGISVLFDRNGELVATFGHARLQEYPNSGGPSTSRISVKNEALVIHSIALLRELKWRGVAMVEWKEDVTDGIPKLLEINPRFWGSLELAVRSGVDFPLLYARAARGEALEPVSEYKAGIICRWLFPGEILRFLTQRPEERENLAAFFRGLPQSAEEWDRSDIRGAISTFICSAVGALNPKYWKYLRR